MTIRSVRRSGARKKSRRLTLEGLEARQVLSITLSPIGGYETGLFDEAAVENIAYHARTERVFTADQSLLDPDGDGPLPAKGGRVGVLDVSDPTEPTLEFSFDVSAYGLPTSVATHGNLLAVAIPNGADETLPGVVAFFRANARRDTGPLKVVTVGSLPDHAIFTPDGDKLLTANEGQPSAPCPAVPDPPPDPPPPPCVQVDPEGSVSIIDLSRGVARATVRTASFAPFNDQEAELKSDGVHLPPNGRTVAQNLEPEYIAVHPNSRVAWVTLEENNALAEVNLRTGRVTKITAFGYKDHSLAGNALDASDRDGPPDTSTDPPTPTGMINIQNWPVRGLYQPDGITVFSDGDELFLATANEGDIFEGEAARVSTLTLDPTAFPNGADLKKAAQLGRLNVSKYLGDDDADGDYDALYSFGARSFSIWTTGGDLVFDSGDDFEQITAAAYPANFNASNTNNRLDDRSDDKGPEPTTVVVGKVRGHKYAFTTVERTGGIMVYDVSEPAAPIFVQYINTRDFTETPGPGTGGDLHPEGLIFVPADDSPNGKNLLIAGYQVSGSVRVFQIDVTGRGDGDDDDEDDDDDDDDDDRRRPGSASAVIVSAIADSPSASAAASSGPVRLATRRVVSDPPLTASARLAATDDAIASLTETLTARRHRRPLAHRAVSDANALQAALTTGPSD